MIQTYTVSRPGADRPGDDWSGITDPVLRRKLQNRCNQRAARRRKIAASCREASHKSQHGHSGLVISNADDQGTGDAALSILLTQRAKVVSQWLPTPPALDASSSSSDGDSEESDPAERQCSHNTFTSIRKAQRCSPRIAYAMTLQRLQAHSQYPLPADHLLSLIYYNVYRGLLQNIAILGLDLDLMTTDEYPSPFLPMSPSASSAIVILPPNLMPTSLQKTMAHHPQWDIFPDPQVRDNALNYGEENINDLELCLDMVGSQSRLQKQSSDEAGVHVWGEPWDIDSWEVTETFLRKYYWLFKGSQGFQKSTNRWRRERGVAQINFERIIVDAEQSTLGA
jgi:hypothetical protein